jgi:AcrR family transcriptional regulator
MFSLDQESQANMSTDEPQESAFDSLPIADPLAGLPETARELLFAAQRVIAKDGLDKLTLARLGEESGQNAALVAYYFGNKMGLLERVVESIIHDECLETTNRIRNLPEGPRLSTISSELKHWSGEGEAYTAFFDLLVYSLRHDSMRQRMVQMYRWYIALNAEMLEVSEAEDPEKRRLLRGVAQLLSAISDGMAIQALIGPDVFPLDEAYDALEFLLEHALPEPLGRENSSSDDLAPGIEPSAEGVLG